MVAAGMQVVKVQKGRKGGLCCLLQLHWKQMEIKHTLSQGLQANASDECM